MTEAVPSLLEPGGFFGTYRVVRPLGKGGMGQVFLVDGPTAGRRYALKLLDPKVAARSPEFVRRFVREAEFTLNSLHPNLVKVYDAGQDEETGLCYLTMEYLSGGSLRELMTNGGALSVEGAVAIARDIAHALEFIGANGLVHRDVKPDNILFTADGHAKLTDLGITRFSDAEEADASQTLAGRVVGTVGYMAPEQMVDAHKVDIRADIYALGVILYEMLAGRRTNAPASAISSLAKALAGDTLPNVRECRPDVSPRLAELVLRMTRPDPADRPASAAYLAELLEDPEILKMPEAERPTAVRESAPPREVASAPPSLVPALTAVFLSLAVLLAVVLWLLLRR